MRKVNKPIVYITVSTGCLIIRTTKEPVIKVEVIIDL